MSAMVYRLFWDLLNVISSISKTYAGNWISASNIAFSIFFGNSGSSAGTPWTTLKIPCSVKNSKSLLPKKKSKSYWNCELSFGVRIVDAPVPAKDLELKSNDLDVTLCAVWLWIVVAVSIVASATLGLKSTVSLRSNSPDGARTSGSTLVDVYVGISL